MATSQTKTDIVTALLAAGVPKTDIMVRAQCSQAFVYKILKTREAEIARLKGNVPDPSVTPPAAPLPQAEPVKNKLKIDPTKPAAPQLEPMAWEIIAKTAMGEDITVKQANAAREIIKQALRDKVPPPINRKMIFKVDVIDVDGTKFFPVGQTIYQIKP